MSTFAYPKPFDFSNELPSVSETKSPAPQKTSRQMRSQQSLRTGVRDDGSLQNHRSAAPGRKLHMKSLPGRSKSSDDTLLLAAQAASRDKIRGPTVTTAPRRGGLGPKTKSGRCLPKPAPSIPIRGHVADTKTSGNRKNNSNQKGLKSVSNSNSLNRSMPGQTPLSDHEEEHMEDSFRAPRSRPRRGVSQVILQDVNGGPPTTSRKDPLPKVVTPPEKSKNEVKKPNSLKNFFHLTPRSKKDALNRSLHSAPAQSPTKSKSLSIDLDDDHDDADDDDDDDDQQDFLSQSERIPSSRNKASATRRPKTNPLRRFAKSCEDNTEDDFSVEEDDDEVVKPASARSRVNRNHQDHSNYKKEKVSRNLKSFQQLLGKKKHKESSSSLKTAPRSPTSTGKTGVATRTSHAASNNKDFQKRGPNRSSLPLHDDYDDESEGSLSPQTVQKPASFLTNMLDTLYDSYIGPDDDQRKDGDSDDDEGPNRHHGSLSRFDLSISGLF